MTTAHIPRGWGRVFPITTTREGTSRKEYFLRLQVYEKKGVGISLVEQYERVGKSVISVGRKTQKNSHEFYGGEKVDESLLVL